VRVIADVTTHQQRSSVATDSGLCIACFIRIDVDVRVDLYRMFFTIVSKIPNCPNKPSSKLQAIRPA
ncbi:MAG TPA: hypothetical protein VM260_23460, partial [Pirellula sp.]|nr:hypothetical protein [Pirellula sp.]